MKIRRSFTLFVAHRGKCIALNQSIITFFRRSFTSRRIINERVEEKLADKKKKFFPESFLVTPSRRLQLKHVARNSDTSPLITRDGNETVEVKETKMTSCAVIIFIGGLTPVDESELKLTARYCVRLECGGSEADLYARNMLDTFRWHSLPSTTLTTSRSRWQRLDKKHSDSFNDTWTCVCVSLMCR